MKTLAAFLSPTFILLTLGLGINAYLGVRKTTKAQHIQERRIELSKPVYPAFAAQELLLQQKSFAGLIPLTGPSSSETVFCKEAENFLQYLSDRHGFHNPDSIWDAPQWEAAFVGDSFVQGACVDSDQNFVRLFEQSMGPTANLGSYGNGPLGQLASLIEYAKEKRPKKVFWVYMQNDLSIDLNIESGNPIFQSYLNGQSQNLMQNQKNYEKELRDYLDQVFQKELKKKNWKDLIGFQHLRKHFELRRQSQNFSEPKVSLNSDFLNSRKIDWDLYRKTVEKAVQLVQSWGGDFYFVILPNSEMLLAKHQESVRIFKRQMNLMIGDLNLRVLDAHQEFAQDKQPFRYFNPMGFYYGHFNQRGYERAAQFLINSQLSREQRKVTVGR